MLTDEYKNIILGCMNEKTSITVSESLLKEIDEVLDYPVNRSDFIEEAIKEYIERKKRSKGIIAYPLTL